MKHVGVTSLDGMKERCRIDEETGCWSWGWGSSRKNDYPVPTVHIGIGVLGQEAITTMPAYRASWLFMGKSIKNGHIVYRTCGNPLCVAPDHLRSGPRQEMYAFVSSTNRNKGQPQRKVANAKNRQKMMVNTDRVRVVERMLAEGKMAKEIRAELKMCGSTIRRIKAGLHLNCTNPVAPQLVRGASIFTMGVQA